MLQWEFITKRNHASVGAHHQTEPRFSGSFRSVQARHNPDTTHNSQSIHPSKLLRLIFGAIWVCKAKGVKKIFTTCPGNSPDEIVPRDHPPGLNSPPTLHQRRPEVVTSPSSPHRRYPLRPNSDLDKKHHHSYPADYHRFLIITTATRLILDRVTDGIFRVNSQ